ncbi:hypothetical protein [Xanthomonas phage BUDD]|nr:hypothetical protein [Xanthomonas phage BUDD]
MEERVEDKILAYLQGEADYDVRELLRASRDEIGRLRARAVDMSWAVDAANDRADAFDPRYN